MEVVFRLFPRFLLLLCKHLVQLSLHHYADIARFYSRNLLEDRRLRLSLSLVADNVTLGRMHSESLRLIYLC